MEAYRRVSLCSALASRSLAPGSLHGWYMHIQTNSFCLAFTGDHAKCSELNFQKRGIATNNRHMCESDYEESFVALSDELGVFQLLFSQANQIGKYLMSPMLSGNADLAALCTRLGNRQLLDSGSKAMLSQQPQSDIRIPT